MKGLPARPTCGSIAQIKYVDEAGVPHWVQTIDQVPEKYRSSVGKPPLPMILQGDKAAAKGTKAIKEAADRDVRASDRFRREQDEKVLLASCLKDAGLESDPVHRDALVVRCNRAHKVR